MIDLHLHTNMSDGSDSPLELLDKVETAGCKVFSVTDHDDLRANAIILAAMKEKKYQARFITGCEISSVFYNKNLDLNSNLHLLCYNFDPEDEGMKEMIAEGARLRRMRITNMFEHLKTKHSIIIPEEDKADILSRDIPGKVHIKDKILKLGHSFSHAEIWSMLDGMESRQYKIPAQKVIDTVHNAGGVVSLAHPIELQKEYNLDINSLFSIVCALMAVGLDAVEVYHSAHSESDIKAYNENISSLNKFAQQSCINSRILVSGGSDYHGDNKDVSIGQLSSCGYAPSDEEITLLNKFMIENKTIKCPKCSSEQKFNYVSFISAERDKELKTLLLKRELNKFACSNCGYWEVVENSLLYLDGNKKLMIYSLYGQDAEESLRSLKTTVTYPPDFRIRLVENAMEMAEKIRIFDAGLLDTAIEYIKGMIVVNELKLGRSQPDEVYFNSVEAITEEVLPDKSENATFAEYSKKQPQAGKVEVLCFHVHMKNATTPIYMPLDMAKGIMADYPEDFGEVSEIGKVVVNLETAMEWVQKKGGQ